MADDIKYIIVKAGPKAGANKVALWEKHPDHPHTSEFPEGGECFIAGSNPRTVALTPDVALGLRDQRIVEITASDAKGTHMPVLIDPADPEKALPLSKAISPTPEPNSADGAAPDPAVGNTDPV